MFDTGPVVGHSEQEGVFALSYSRIGWTVAIEWGTEAADSPMCAAAAYGVGDTAAEAVASALEETRWEATTKT